MFASSYSVLARTCRSAALISRPMAGLAIAGCLFFPSAGQAQTRDAGSEVLSDQKAAQSVNWNGWEPRERNWRENSRIPADRELRQFFDESKHWGRCGEALKANITGGFRGTTDEIIQWAAQKWGIEADIIRAVAVKESYWNQDAAADWDRSGSPRAFGLTQIRRDVNPGTYPLSAESTAFNLDFYGATLRYYYDGCADWLGSNYWSGDIWGAIGAWYTGRWYDDGAQWYISEIKRALSDRTWEQFD